MSVAIIIQARMGSTRFPGKMLAPLGGKPVIRYVIDRALDVVGVDWVVVAMTNRSSDAPLLSYVKGIGNGKLAYYRGNERNVLKRFYHAAHHLPNKPDVIVRITGDCPLIDPRSISNCIGNIQKPKFYCGVNVHENQYYGITNSPDGNDCEAFTIEMLDAAYMSAGPYEQEHVTTWMRKQERAVSTESAPGLSHIHYSINTIDDLRVCESLLNECGEGSRWEDYAAACRSRANAV